LGQQQAGRQMSQIHIYRKMSGPYNLNTYVLTCSHTNESVVIDPGGAADEWGRFFQREKKRPVSILHTHGHADQFFSIPVFKTYYAIPSCLHRDDDLFFKHPDIREQTFRAVGLPPPYPADVQLADHEVITFGSNQIQVIHTPGHTPGSVCFLCAGHLFTGDAIFVGEAGRTDLPGGNLDQLIKSIKTRILLLDKKTIIHPGHHHTGDRG
jgi:hydroxyacylglutathione hydrolase